MKTFQEIKEMSGAKHEKYVVAASNDIAKKAMSHALDVATSATNNAAHVPTKTSNDTPVDHRTVYGLNKDHTPITTPPKALETDNKKQIQKRINGIGRSTRLLAKKADNMKTISETAFPGSDKFREEMKKTMKKKLSAKLQEGWGAEDANQKMQDEYDAKDSYAKKLADEFPSNHPIHAAYKDLTWKNGWKSSSAYTQAKKTCCKEEVELEEGNSKRHPLEGHAYHSKSNSSLRYIIKDASEAARAMKDHSPTSESKYLDQANDASTVLGYRQKNGMPDWYKERYKPAADLSEQLVASINNKLSKD